MPLRAADRRARRPAGHRRRSVRLQSGAAGRLPRRRRARRRRGGDRRDRRRRTARWDRRDRGALLARSRRCPASTCRRSSRRATPRRHACDRSTRCDPERRASSTKRVLPDLDASPLTETHVVPNLDVVHDRASVEVMRGCVKGCRFCQAGYIYRPLRERDPRRVLAQTERAVEAHRLRGGLAALALAPATTAASTRC